MCWSQQLTWPHEAISPFYDQWRSAMYTITGYKHEASPSPTSFRWLKDKSWSLPPRVGSCTLQGMFNTSTSGQTRVHCQYTVCEVFLHKFHKCTYFFIDLRHGLSLQFNFFSVFGYFCLIAPLHYKLTLINNWTKLIRLHIPQLTSSYIIRQFYCNSFSFKCSLRGWVNTSVHYGVSKDLFDWYNIWIVLQIERKYFSQVIHMTKTASNVHKLLRKQL